VKSVQVNDQSVAAIAEGINLHLKKKAENGITEEAEVLEEEEGRKY
jgi:hypothetical protein